MCPCFESRKGGDGGEAGMRPLVQCTRVTHKERVQTKRASSSLI